MNLYALLAGRFPADRSKPCFLLTTAPESDYGLWRRGGAGAGRLWPRAEAG
jgi:hypothetical protein